MELEGTPDRDHKTHALLSAQIRALERIASGAPLPDVLDAIARTIEEQSGREAVVSIFLVDPTGSRLHVGAAPSLPEAFNRAFDGIAIERGVGTCADAAARATVVVTPDIAAAAGWQAFAHLPMREGLASAWSMPILSSG